MTTFQCPTCPAGSYCSCRNSPYEFNNTVEVLPYGRPGGVPATSSALDGGVLPARVVRTVPATVSPEQMAALEVRLQEAEKRLEMLRKAHDVDLRDARLRLEWLETALPDAKSMWDLFHADTRKRITVLEQAASASRGSTPRTRPAHRRRASSSPRTPGRKATPSGVRSPARPAGAPRKRAKRSRHMASAKTK